MRIYFKGRAELIEFSRPPSHERLSEFDAVLTSERYAKGLEDAGYIVEKCGFEYDRWTTEEIFDLLKEKDFEARFAEKRIDYYFAVKRME